MQKEEQGGRRYSVVSGMCWLNGDVAGEGGLVGI